MTGWYFNHLYTDACSKAWGLLMGPSQQGPYGWVRKLPMQSSIAPAITPCRDHHTALSMCVDTGFQQSSRIGVCWVHCQRHHSMVSTLDSMSTFQVASSNLISAKQQPSVIEDCIPDSHLSFQQRSTLESWRNPINRDLEQLWSVYHQLIHAHAPASLQLCHKVFVDVCMSIICCSDWNAWR